MFNRFTRTSYLFDDSSSVYPFAAQTHNQNRPKVRVPSQINQGSFGQGQIILQQTTALLMGKNGAAGNMRGNIDGRLIRAGHGGKNSEIIPYPYQAVGPVISVEGPAGKTHARLPFTL